MQKLTSSIYTFEKLIENNFLYMDFCSGSPAAVSA